MEKNNFRRDEEQSHDDIIYGRNAVMEALTAEKSIDTLYVLKNSSGLGKHIAMTKQLGGIVKEVTDEKLRSLINDPDAKHGGVAASIAAVEYSTVEDIFEQARLKNKPPFIIIADEIQDPHNLGALIRTADAVGADGIIIPKRRSAGLTATVFKTSAGAASWLKVARVPNLVDTIKYLKQQNVWVYGAEADGTPFRKANLSGAVALVIGSEGEGLGRLVRENCDEILSIDMFGHVNSLNASVSGAILMYEVQRQRFLAE